jgi:tRNA G18 (ribose-2'-O)-methylase SpoU
MLMAIPSILANPREVNVLVGAERDGSPETIVAAADHAVGIPISSYSLGM